MNRENVQKIINSDYLKLLPIMGLAFYIAFIPHHNYPYPVHIDEWIHLAQSNAILKAQSTTYLDPWRGQSVMSLGTNPEIGFQLFWAVFHQISDISWLTIFKYFPGIVFMITILSSYVLTWRQGFGWEAAFFTSLIPTTVGILGPGFLIPVAMGLLFIPLCLFISFNFRSWWAYVVLAMFFVFLFSIHVLTAAAVVLALVPYVLLSLKSDWKHSLKIAAILILPFLVPVFWVSEQLPSIVQLLLTPQTPLPYVDLPRMIPIYGYLPVSFCLLGVILLAVRRERINYSLILGLLTLLLMLTTFFTFHRGIPIMYYRGLQYTMLMMGIVAGAGLMGIKNLSLPVLKASFIGKHIGKILCLVLVGVTLFTVVPIRQHTPYYYMIDDVDYKAFTWIKENVGDSYERAVLDPWKAAAFVGITGKYIYALTHEYPLPSDLKALDFLNNASKDTSFLRENGISIVYTRGVVDNPDLIKVRDYVYLLK